MEKTIESRVQEALEEIKPKIQADGGDIELVAVENGVVKVRLKGACVGCPMSAMTLQMGVETHIKKNVPEISRVQAIT